MGGSDGGYSDYTPGEGGGALDCEKVSFETTLLSTYPEILATIKTGDFLPVKRGDYSAIVVKPSGERVGSIVTSASQLLACIDGGNNYQAEVLEIEDGACRVKVTFAGK